MKFLHTQPIKVFAILIAAMGFAVCFGVCLSGWQSYQPPGNDLWRAL